MKKSIRCTLGFHKPDTKTYFHHGITSCYCSRCKQRLFQSNGKWFAITKNPKNIKNFYEKVTESTPYD